MTRSEVVEFETMIESTLEAGGAAASAHRTVEVGLANWPLIDALREDFSRRVTFYGPLGVTPQRRRLHLKMQRQS